MLSQSILLSDHTFYVTMLVISNITGLFKFAVTLSIWGSMW